jgi:hypothetical protein
MNMTSSIIGVLVLFFVLLTVQFWFGVSLHLRCNKLEFANSQIQAYLVNTAIPPPPNVTLSVQGLPPSETIPVDVNLDDRLSIHAEDVDSDENIHVVQEVTLENDKPDIEDMEAEVEAEAAVQSLSSLSVTDLRNLCKEKNLKFNQKDRKADLIAILNSSQ